jgi:hypothetical protein
VKPTRHVTVFLLLSALTFAQTHSYAQGGQGKGKSYGGGQTSSQMTGKDSTETNAKWSADPERGWIRTDEHRAHTTSKQNHGKQKANGEKDKKK